MWDWFQQEKLKRATQSPLPNTFLPPEVYLAKPQDSGGIPGLANDDEPGSATCDIYKLDDSDPPALVAVTGLERTVYNLSQSDIGQDWIVVVRTKFGKWFALLSGFDIAFGKLDGELARDSSATMSVWAGSTLADTGDNITVNDWLLSTGDSLATATKCVAVKYHTKWYVIAAECPT